MYLLTTSLDVSFLLLLLILPQDLTNAASTEGKCLLNGLENLLMVAKEVKFQSRFV